jgi:ankyrin repeat protein
VKWDQDEFTNQVSEYLENGGDPNIRVNKNGWSLLHLAAEFLNCEAAKNLLDNGANPNSIDKEGWSPLHLAIDAVADSSHQTQSELDLDILVILVAGGAGVELKTNDGLDARDIALDYGDDVANKFDTIII